VKTDRPAVAQHGRSGGHCLPANLPEYIEVDANLRLGDSIHLSQVKLPAGVEATAFRGLDEAERAEHDSVVVSVHASTLAAEVDAMAEAAPVSPTVATVKEEEAKAKGEEED
jgi:large subunit ribosomal protein L25